MQLKPEMNIAQSEDQVSCEVDGMSVIMSVENGEYYRLDDIGSKIWSLIAAPLSIEALCQKLSQEFDVSLEQCKEDVLKLLNQMLDRKLIKLV